VIGRRQPQVYECELCMYQAHSHQALSWHMYDKHEMKHAIRRVLHTSVCECCMREFWSRSRLFTHVAASSKVCSRFYRQYGTNVSPEMYEQLEKEAEELTVKLKKQGRRRTYSRQQPPERLSGPLRMEAMEGGVRHDCLLRVPPQRGARWRRRPP